MALFRRFFYKTPPDRLLEISERVFVFDSCLSSDVMRDDEYKMYLDGVAAELKDHFPDGSFMVFNFGEGEQRSQISDILTQYDMIVMDYPRQHESCPLLPLEMIHHFLRSSESWLSLEGQQNVLLMHCERGYWPILAFMLSGLLLYRNQYIGEQKTLEMVQKQASKELLHLLSPLNPQPSHLRYLQYISRRNLGSDWPPSDTPLLLDFLILRNLPHFEGRKRCRPILRVYGQDTESRANRSSILLFSTPKIKKHKSVYQEEECILVKLDVQCCVQGDVVVECIHLHDDLMSEEMIFRVMFHTSFVQANILTLQRDEMDILWDVVDHFPENFKAEVLFSGVDALMSTITTAPIPEADNDADIASFGDFFEVEEIFSDVVDEPDHKRDLDSFVVFDTASDDTEGKEVWRGDVEPNAYVDCASDDSNHEHDDMHSDRIADSIKDITVDDVLYWSDEEADSSPKDKSYSLLAATPREASLPPPSPPPPPPPLPHLPYMHFIPYPPAATPYQPPPSLPSQTSEATFVLQAAALPPSPPPPPPPPPLPHLPCMHIITSPPTTIPYHPPPSLPSQTSEAISVLQAAASPPPPPPPPPYYQPYMRIIASPSLKSPPSPPPPPPFGHARSVLLADSVMSTIITSSTSSDDDNYEELFETEEIIGSPSSTTQLPSSLPPPPPPPLPVPWNSVYTSTLSVTNPNAPPPSICEPAPPSARLGPPPPPPPPPPPLTRTPYPHASNFSF